MEKATKNKARLLIILVSLATIGAIILISKLEFSYDFESFFPEGSKETEFYYHFRDAFGTDNDFLLIGVENDKGVFREDFLLRVDSLTSDLEKLPYANQVISITNTKEYIREPMLGQFFEKPIVHLDDFSRIEQDSSTIYSSNDYIGTLVSTDAKSVAIWVQHENYLSKIKSDTLATALEQLMAGHTFDKVHLMGRTIGQKTYLRMMLEEMIIFMSLSFFLILIFLFISFRSFWGIWIPVVVVMLAIIWNLATVKILGHKIELLLTILPTIIFVVGMSDVIHIISRYLDELRLGFSKTEALKKAMKEVGLATLLTSLTTAIGFLSLLTSSVVPIQRFGTYIAIGVLIAFILAFTLIPAMLYLRKKPVKIQKHKRIINWTEKLHHSFLWLLRNKKTIIVSFIILIGVGIYGATKIVSDNYLLEDVGPDHPLRIELDFFDQNFSGARPIEVAIVLDSTVKELTPELLNQIDQIDQFLVTDYGVGTIISPAVIIKKANKSYNGGKSKYLSIPESKSRLKKLEKMLSKSEILSNYWNSEKGLIRIYGQTSDLGRKHFIQKNKNLQEFKNKKLKDAPFEIVVTGTARLMDLNNETVSITMIYGLLIAFGLIALIIGVLYKSLKMVLISLIPNMLPLLMIAGFMGYVGIPLKVTTSIVFTIAFGIAVDDTIHFLSKFRLELSKGKSLLYALKRTYISTGKAIVITSLILCGGFLTLVFSDFLGTYYVGLLISLTLVFAVLSDLFLLPVLIIMFYRKKKN